KNAAPSPIGSGAFEPHSRKAPRPDKAPKDSTAEQVCQCAKEELARCKLQWKCSPRWIEIPSKHREVLTITLDPPGNERMLLKMEKHVNACVIAILIAIELTFGAYMGR